MSSHRFPSEEPPSSFWLAATDGPIGTIRAHEQAAIDQFLLFAERERQRLEARLIEAEMRCREAEAELHDATRENQLVTEQLYATWQQLQADRELAERRVAERLAEARAEAEELVHWSDRQPLPAVEPSRDWTTQADEAPQPAPAAPSPLSPAPAASPAADAFFGPDDDIDVPWARLDDDPPQHVHEELLARHPRRDAAAQPPAAGGQSQQSSGLTDQQASDQEFWRVDESAAALRINQLESTFMSLLPMLALVAVLVVILAWIG